MTPTLHLVCGKIAAGKSTLASRLAVQPGTVCIREDSWLAALFPGEISSVDDYIRCSRRLRGVMGSHVEDMLGAGLSVVLDFPANTVRIRQWMRAIFENAGVPHELHFLDVPDEICKARLARRNAEAAHEFTASEAEYDLITRYFEPPSPEEGFNIVVYSER